MLEEEAAESPLDPSETSTGYCATSLLADDGEELELVSTGHRPEKDPRKIARGYQLDLCKKALEENIIVYLGTGCGKTHIAVLLMYEFRHLIRKPQKSVCVFLAPTVALVQQQAKVIEESTDFIVGIHCGSLSHLKSHGDWEKEIKEYEVLVMTPQILLRNLSHSFIKMDMISLLIFDECHHAQVQKNHPYAEIMRIFYQNNEGKVPRVFGMTASPVVGKGASNLPNLPKAINSLEHILDAKVCSVDMEELESLVESPAVKIYRFGPVTNETCRDYSDKLEEIKRQCVSEIGKKVDDQQSLQCLRSTKKVIVRMHDNIIWCMKHLGLWGALQASQILLGVDDSEWNALVETEGSVSDSSSCDRYLTQASHVFADCGRDRTASDISSEVEVLKEPFFSKKLLRLIGVLSTFRLQPNMKCIVFVNRIITARSLSYILQNLKLLSSWKCDFLVGVHSGLKNVSRKTMNGILEKFRTGELNLLIATKVGEEGLDIQTCCLVVRFDLPETVASFIQSRGRARMPQSEYAFLVDSGNQKELDLIESFIKEEDRMNVEISVRTSDDMFDSPQRQVYKVDVSGASISSGYSISLLHHYCSKLPHDEYFDPKPTFFYFDDSGGTVCQVNLPSNAPIHQVVSAPLTTMEAAKKDACLKAIQELHQLGALNNFLLPDQEDVEDVLEGVSSDSNDSEVETSRGELHKMLVPAVLKESCTNSENQVHLNSYYIEFCPIPGDRMYKKFGLFVRERLPKEAENMKVELHLARGRSVITRLVPYGISTFTRDEIILAVKFQAMFLKIILDRSEFVNEFVLLGNEVLQQSNPTSYLLLPVIMHGDENRMTVDWEIQGRCLSSPIFRNPVDVVDKKILRPNSQLQLANGCRSIGDIVNSLVYTPHKKNFYFIVGIIHEKNGYSPYKHSSGPSHMEQLITVSGIQLKYPEQPLLLAKPLFCLHNLLHNRKQNDSEPEELDEYFIDLVPELCWLKIIGFSKDIGSSVSLLPSLMHRLENFLVAIELRCLLSASFPEGAEVTSTRVLEALTTEKCQERFSLERLEILGDAFLKFAVGRHLFLLYATLDEGELTRRRSNIVNNFNLVKLALRNNLQVYIRDQPFDPFQFFALGRPCPRICTKESKGTIHDGTDTARQANGYEIKCSKGHHWLFKKTIADAVEALVGAFIVDSGFKAAAAFLKWIGIEIDFEAPQVINICQASNSYMSLAPSMDTAALEDLLGYHFLYKGLLLQAFVHPSFYKQGGGCYQRLEFLGDAVLDYLITSYLFSAYPKLKPGNLTDIRSALVNNRAFANVAIDRSFHTFLLSNSSGLSEAINKYVDFVKTNGSGSHQLEVPKCPKVLGDLLESYMGAMLLDTGLDLNFIWKTMLSFLDPVTSFSSVKINPVRELRELSQSHNWDLHVLASKKGKTFFVEVKLSGQDLNLIASTRNSNRREAVKIASEKLLVELKDQGYVPKFNFLEEILRSSSKMEARLVGYDETPVKVVSQYALDLENLKVEAPVGGNGHSKVDSTIKKSDGLSPPVVDADRKHRNEAVANQKSERDSQNTARQVLHEVCTANYWKPPLFECCSEEGPSHLRWFTYKVIVVIEDAPDLVLLCIGAPQNKKKAAAENAAEAALWYLEREGYLLQSEKSFRD